MVSRDKNGRFVKGHTVPKEWREKYRKLNKGKHYSPDTEFKNGHTPWNKGRERLFVKGNKNPMRRPEVRKKVSERNKIVIKKLYKEHPEIIEKIKKETKKAMQRPKIRQKIQKTWFKRGQRASPKTEFKKGSIPWNKGKPWNKRNKRNSERLSKYNCTKSLVSTNRVD